MGIRRQLERTALKRQHTRYVESWKKERDRRYRIHVEATTEPAPQFGAPSVISGGDYIIDDGSSFSSMTRVPRKDPVEVKEEDRLSLMPRCLTFSQWHRGLARFMRMAKRKAAEDLAKFAPGSQDPADLVWEEDPLPAPQVSP